MVVQVISMELFWVACSSIKVMAWLDTTKPERLPMFVSFPGLQGQTVQITRPCLNHLLFLYQPFPLWMLKSLHFSVCQSSSSSLSFILLLWGICGLLALWTRLPCCAYLACTKLRVNLRTRLSMSPTICHWTITKRNSTRVSWLCFMDSIQMDQISSSLYHLKTKMDLLVDYSACIFHRMLGLLWKVVGGQRRGPSKCYCCYF